MNLAAFFTACNLAGIRLANRNGQLQMRGPAEAITPAIKAAAAEHKAVIMAMLQPANEKHEIPIPDEPPPAAEERAAAGTALEGEGQEGAAEDRAEQLAWDGQQADGELRQALEVIDAALSATWLSPAQRNVLAVFRQQGTNYHLRRDALLFDSPLWVEAHVERWRSEHEEVIRKRPTR